MYTTFVRQLNKSAAKQKSWWLDIICLALVITFFYALFLDQRPLMAPDEGRYAEIPREMVESGNYITPKLNGLTYLEKPPLFYWMQSLSIKLFGVHEWNLRLMNMMMGVLGAIITYIAGRRLFNRRTGLLASFILATSALYYCMAHFVTLDMTLSFFLCATLFSFILGANESKRSIQKIYFWSMYIFAAGAVLTKGLIGIAFPGIIIFLWIAVFRRWRDLKNYCLPTGIILFLIIALPWHLLAQSQTKEFFQFYFLDQHFLRYFTDYADRQQPIWFLSLTLLGGFFPWTFFLPQALKMGWTKNIAERNTYTTRTFLFIWTVAIFIIFQFSQSVLIPYILPLFPPLALLLAYYLNHIWHLNRTKGSSWSLLTIICVAGIAGIAALVVLSSTDLKEYANLAIYCTFSTLILMAIAALLAFAMKHFRAAITALIASSAVLFTTINFSYNTIDKRPIKPLAIEIKKRAQPNDHVMVYHNYYQDLPVYLGRKITIVHWLGELEFGYKNDPNGKKQIIRDSEFKQKWHDKERIYLILSQSDYDYLLAKGYNMHLIATTQRNVLASNIK